MMLFAQPPISKPVLKAVVSTKISTVQKFVFKRLDESTQRSFSIEGESEDNVSTLDGKPQVRLEKR